MIQTARNGDEDVVEGQGEGVSVEEPTVTQTARNGDDDGVEGLGEGVRGRYLKRKNRQCNSSRAASYEMETNESDSDDSDFDPGAIVDSDYDISDVMMICMLIMWVWMSLKTES